MNDFSKSLNNFRFSDVVLQEGFLSQLRGEEEGSSVRGVIHVLV